MDGVPKLIVSDSKEHLPKHLNSAIVDCCVQAIRERGVFTIALSGGSLPSFLSSKMKEAFDSKSAEPNFSKWHVILADERCVPATNDNSNLKALKETLFSVIPLPKSQIYGINEELLAESTAEVAADYELTVRKVLSLSGGELDLAVLGFGPDGHTCSLFPDHPILAETSMVASITDSPKPPPNRITLTLPVLNTMTRHVIFCGAGNSKAPILQACFASIMKAFEVPDAKVYDVIVTKPPPYPCAMVEPSTAEMTYNTLVWVVDADAVEGLHLP